jgi:hypothetical protein
MAFRHAAVVVIGGKTRNTAARARSQKRAALKR